MPESTTAYADDAGRPRLRDSIVAFIDILGFSNIATSTTSIEESQQLLDKIADAIDDSRSFVREAIPGGETGLGRRWATKFFSDNLAFGYPFDDNDHARIAQFIIRSAQRYQLKMTLSGFFVRGALTQGPVCLTDEIIFGSALIECYLLESKASIVPRIVLAEPLQQLVTNAYRADRATNPSKPQANDLICRDVDGWWFVNYLDAARDSSGVQWQMIDEHKKSILESLSHTTRHDVLPKYGWACRYHNVFCHWHRDDPEYSDQYRISRVDEQSTIYRLGDTTTKG